MEKNNHHKEKNKNKNNILSDGQLTKISKQMTFILRHNATNFGLKIESSGFIKLDDLLNIDLLKKSKVTYDMVKEIVAKDSKQRFTLENRPPYYIKANQGHSIQEVKNEECLQNLDNYWEYQFVVHGTNFEAWEKIKLSGGLNKMGRNCIHFAIGYPADKEVISGMRVSCDVFIEIDIIRAVENNIPFFISGNKVILTSGINGVLPIEFILLAKTSKNAILFAQNYEFILYFIFNSGSQEIFEKIIIIDIKNHSIYKVIDFLIDSSIDNDHKKLNILIDILIEYKLFREKIIIILPNNRVIQYKNFISKFLKNIRYKSFFLTYIPIPEEFNFEKLNNEDLLTCCISTNSIFTAQYAKKILISDFEPIDKIEKNENDIFICKTTNNQIIYNEKNDSIISHNHNDIIATGVISDIEKDYSLQYIKYSILRLNKTQEKYYLLIDIIYSEDSDFIDGVDYFFFKDQHLEDALRGYYEFKSNSHKINLEKLIQELDKFLNLHLAKDGAIITLIQNENLERFKRMLKQNLIKSPIYLFKNILVYDNNNQDLINKEITEKAIIFSQQYINNKEKQSSLRFI